MNPCCKTKKKPLKKLPYKEQYRWYPLVLSCMILDYNRSYWFSLCQEESQLKTEEELWSVASSYTSLWFLWYFPPPLPYLTFTSNFMKNLLDLSLKENVLDFMVTQRLGVRRKWTQRHVVREKWTLKSPWNHMIHENISMIIKITSLVSSLFFLNRKIPQLRRN